MLRAQRGRGETMSERLLLGFETAQQVCGASAGTWRWTIRPRRRVPPLLVRLLFERWSRHRSGVHATTDPRWARFREALDERARRTCPAHARRMPGARLTFAFLGRGGRRFLAGARCHLMTGSYPRRVVLRVRRGDHGDVSGAHLPAECHASSARSCSSYTATSCAATLPHGMGRAWLLQLATALSTVVAHRGVSRPPRGASGRAWEGMPWGLRRAAVRARACS